MSRNKESLVESTAREAAKKDMAEARLAALKAEIKANPDWQSRFLYIIDVDGKKGVSKIPAADDGNVVLDTLLDGLSKDDSNALIVALVEQEWLNAKSSDPATFMRGSSLFKTAMMHHFKQELKKNPKMRDQYIENPIQFVHNLRLPVHLKNVLAPIIQEKANNNQDFARFAHNIVFSIVCGPMQDVDLNDLRIKDSTRLLTDSNRMFSQKESAAQDAAAIITSSNPMIKPETMNDYAEALDTLMSRISKDYPKGSIPREVVNNVLAFSYHVSPKYKEANVVTAAVSGVAKAITNKVARAISRENKEDRVNFTNEKAQSKSDAPDKAPPQAWVRAKRPTPEDKNDLKQEERATKRQSTGPKI